MTQTRHQIVIASFICLLSLAHCLCPPKMWSPPKCDRPCKCDWVNTLYCNPRTSHCVCREGYENVHCTDDINECLLSDTLCNEREYCQNINGSYSCECIRGFFRSSVTNRCEPCADPTHGDTCPQKCNCHPTHAILCEQVQGWCMCRRGWEGEACDTNIDDCKGVTCPTGVCQDGIGQYFCRCELGQRKIKGKCLEYRTDFVASNHNPDIGELVDVYILFHLPPLYHSHLRFGDDFNSTLTGGESWDGCVVSLFKHNEVVYGSEAFFKLFNEDQPLPVEYHYYSSYKVRFLTEGQKTLTIKPYSETTITLKLDFNVQYRSLSVRHCLEDMTINGTSPYPDEPKHAEHQMKRQGYKTLRVEYNASGQCSDVPWFQWQYYKVDERAFKEMKDDSKKYCWFSKYFQPVDIINLAYKSGDTEISDHMSQTEVIQKSTLPVGPVLVCVSAYINNDQRSSATTCGFIKVKHSGLIFGSIVPRLYRKYVGGLEEINLRTNFWDADDPTAELKYDWHCYEVDIVYGDDDMTEWCFVLAGRTNPNPNHVGVFWSWGYIEVSVSNKYQNVVTARIYIKRNKHVTAGEVELMCLSSCEEKISKYQVLHLRVTNPRVVQWTITANKSQIPAQRVWSYKKGLDLTLRMGKPLEDNTKYRIRATLKQNSVTHFADYKFRTEKSQTHGNCLITPSTGQLVTDRFTFKCSGFKDPYGRGLTYRLLQIYTSRRTSSPEEALIGYSGTTTISDVTISQFKGGDVFGGELMDVELPWEVWAPFGRVFRSTITLYNMTLDKSLNVSDVLDTDMASHRRTNFQDNLRRTKDIATMINMEWKTNVTQVNFGFIRQQLLQNMNNNERSMALSTIRLKTFAMQAILERVDEIIEQGLGDGLDMMTFLVNQLERFHGDIFEQLYKAHLQCLDRLSSVVHDVGRGLHKDPARVNERDIRKNKRESIRLIDAVEHICQLIAWHITPTRKFMTVYNYNMKMSMKKLKRKEFDYMHQKIGSIKFRLWDIQSTGDDVLIFMVYEKSPLAWAGDTVFGKVPLVGIRFFMATKHTKTVQEKWKFTTPATFIIRMTAPQGKGTEIPLNLLVNTLSKKIIHSSCVTMTVTPSTTENTLLEVISTDQLTLKVQFALTMSTRSFEGHDDEKLLDLPMSLGNRFRINKNIIFLPRISSRKILGDNEIYRVRITIMKGQSIGTAPRQSTPDAILKSLLRENVTELYTTKVAVTSYSMSCKYVNQEDYTFMTDVCKMQESSIPKKIFCSCLMAGSYTGSNRVDQSLITILGAEEIAEDVIKDFDNPLVSFMVAALWIIFLAALFWAKKKDKLDGMKSTATILEDNEQGDKHVYLVCISTGASMTSPPSANVYMYFRGTNSSTRPHVFWDKHKVTFKPGSNDWFVMTASDDIGDVTSAVLWTVQRGGEKDQSWNLLTVFIENMLTQEAWVCRYNAWLSISPDGQDVVEIPATHEADLLQNQRAQLIDKCNHDLRNDNLWFGFIGKTPYDKYSRVRRLVTALTVILSLLLFNLALFDVHQITKRFILAPFKKMHTDSVKIGLKSSIITTLIGMALSFLFKRIRPWSTTVDVNTPPYDGAESPPLEEMKKNNHDARAKSSIDGTMNSYDVIQNAAENRRTPEKKSPSEKSLGESNNAVKSSVASTSSSTSSSSSSSSSTDDKSKSKEKRKVEFHIDPHPRLVKLYHDMQSTWETLRNQRDLEPFEAVQSESAPFSLPSWFIVVIWPVVVAYNIFLSYFAILYGPSVSFNRSLDWLVAFCTGLLANILVYQPLLTIVFSYVMVHVLGKTYRFRTRFPLQCLEDTRNLIKSHFMAGTPEGLEHRRQSIHGNVRIRGSQSVAKDIMRRLHLEGIARQILRDLVLYSLFVVTALVLINQDLRTTPRYWINYNLKRRFLRGIELEQGMNISTMWDYFVDTVIPILQPTKSDSIRIENTYLFGTTRLRQVRIVEDEGICADMMEQLVAFYQGYLCSQSYTKGTEDTGTYANSWDNPLVNDTNNYTIDSDSPFRYWSAEELDHSYFHSGEHGYYSAGGYIKLITPDVPKTVTAALQDLKKQGWIDQLTRCLFFEFTLYNGNENIISGVRIAFEFVNYGAVFPTVSFDSSSFLSETNWHSQIAQVYICFCVLYYTYAAYRDMREDGLKYFSKVWNLMEMSVVILAFTSIAFLIRRHYAQLEVTKKYETHGDSRYTDFSKLFDLENVLEQILGCLGALIILKTLKLITFNPFMAKFTKTIEISAPNLAGYLVLTVIYTVAFSCTGFLLFGTMMTEYSTIHTAMIAHIRFILGGPDLQSMFAADWVLGRVFAMLGLGITQYIVLNIFISILRESFGLAHQMTYRDEETTVMYVKNMALRYMGISKKR